MAESMVGHFNDMGNMQRQHRVKRFFLDQLGRRFFAWADKDNQRPIGEFVIADLTGTFQTPPWIPPMGYIDWPDHDTLDFQWRFETLASELAGYAAEWYSIAQQLAQAIPCPVPDVGGDVHPKLIGIMGPPPMSPEIPLACAAGERWIIGRIGAPVNKRLEKLLNLGRAVTSTLAMEAIRERVRLMIEAQERGEPIDVLQDMGTVQVLESADAWRPVEDAVQEEFDARAVTYNQFAKEARQHGKSMADISVAWQAHKASLVEA